MTEQNAPTQKGNPWLMLIVAYIAALTAPVNMMKVPAVAPALMGVLQVDTGGIGFLMSAYTLTGVILALPAGAIARKFGYRNAGLIALAFSLVGSCVGCFYMDYTALMVCRIFEGIGLCMLNIVLVSTAYTWFPPEKRGLTVGISCTNVALAACVVQPILAALGDNFGLNATWYFTAGFTIVGTILFLLYKNPASADADPALKKIPMFKVIGQHKTIILFFVLFTLHNFCIVGALNNFMPTYLVEGYGMSMGVASLYMALIAGCTVIFMPLVGKISDKIGREKIFLIVGSVCGIIIACFIFSTPPIPIIIILCVLAAIESACIVGIAQTAGPKVLGSPELAPVSSSFLTFGQNIGQFLGPMVFGMSIAAIGWQSSAWFIMVPAFAINLIVALIVKIK